LLTGCGGLAKVNVPSKSLTPTTLVNVTQPDSSPFFAYSGMYTGRDPSFDNANEALAVRFHCGEIT
jgi:hypothetical protein